MFQNHIKIALRNLWSQRFFTGLNLFGLAAGMAVALTLALFVKNELSFDRFHGKADRIYREYSVSSLKHGHELLQDWGIW